MTEALSLLLVPFGACVAFVLIHAYLGVHVLRRNIVFADLALAQLSALGATLAFAIGYAPTSPAGFAYALALTAVGAAFCLKAGAGLGGALPMWLIDAAGYVPKGTQTPAALSAMAANAPLKIGGINVPHVERFSCSRCNRFAMSERSVYLISIQVYE